MPPGRQAAGEGHHVDARVLGERGARFGAAAQDEVGGAGREPGLVEGPHQQDRGGGRQLAGLEDDGVAGEEGGRDLPGRLKQGVVPGGDQSADADGLVGHPAEGVVAAGVHHPAGAGAGDPAVVAEAGDDVGDVVFALDQALAGVERLGAGELLGVALDDVGGAQQESAALTFGGVRPGAGVEGPTGRGDRGLGVGPGSLGHPRDERAVRRTADLPVAAGHRSAPFSVHIQICHAPSPSMEFVAHCALNCLWWNTLAEWADIRQGVGGSRFGHHGRCPDTLDRGRHGPQPCCVSLTMLCHTHQGRPYMSPRPHPGREYVLTLSCPDTAGLVHAVSGFLVRNSGNILQSQQFDDRLQDRFFMRVHFDVSDPNVDLEILRYRFGPVAEAHGITWTLRDAATPTRTLIMVSRFGHCLNDLLFRCRSGALNIEIPAIVSNHRDFEGLAETYGIPFHHIPVTRDTKPEAEARLLELVRELNVDLVVLARYMQVLSDDLCKELEGRAINIHHSFLPSFKGAKPYQQAYERGVKLVGATAHYVTSDLDEGQIIEQDVIRVDHSLDPDDLVTVGRDVEAQVLAHAVKWHTESRVMVEGNRTVVFR